MINHCQTRVGIRHGQIVHLRICRDCGVEGVCVIGSDSGFPLDRITPAGRPVWKTRCRACYRAYRRTLRARPGARARARVADMKWYAAKRQKDPTWARDKNRIGRALHAERAGTSLTLAVHDGRNVGGRVEAAVFAEWLRAYQRSQGFTIAELAIDLGLQERRVRYWILEDQPEVSFDAVDIALINALAEVEVTVIALHDGIISTEPKPVYTIHDLYGEAA